MRNILFVIAGLLLFLASCKKDNGNPLQDISNLEEGSYLKLDSTINLYLDYNNLATSTVGVTVEQVGADIDHIDLFVVKGSSIDTTEWNFLKSVPYAGPGTVLTATGTEIATALGTSLDDYELGAGYTVYNRVILKDGRQFDLSTTNPDAAAAADYHASYSWQASVACAYEAGTMAGDYEIIEDDWADYSAGDIVTGAIEEGPGVNQLTMHVYPNPSFADVLNPIIIDINPVNGAASVPDVNYGDYGGGSNFSANGSGTVYSCIGRIELNLAHHVGSTDYGNYVLILQKQ